MRKQAAVHRKSMTSNGVFSLVSKIVTMLVPLVVYPYIMRVLGAESYGKVTYAESLVSYFSLLAVLGIGSYAQRECSVLRDNKDGLQKVSSRVFALSLIMTSISLVIYLCLLFFVPSMQSEWPLFLVFSLWIVGSGLSMEWLYTSQERFDLISIRGIISKLLYIVLCFALVKSKDSYLLFAIIIVFTGTVFSMIWNVYGIIRGQCGIVPHLGYASGFTECLKPIFFLALLTIGSKLFTDFDIMMIKWFSSVDSDREVGLYNSAILIPKALDELLMTVSAVITPQLFIAIRNKDSISVQRIMNKTSNALFFIAIPAIITCCFFSEEILLIYAGPEYISAAPVLKVYSFIIMGVLSITLAGTRTYIARQKEKKLFFILIFGAALNIGLNYIFIINWGIIGAALATLAAYVVVMTVELTLERTWHFVFDKDKLKYLSAGLVVVIVFGVVKTYLGLSPIMMLCVAILLAGIVYLSLLSLMRESTIFHVVGIIKKKLFRKD